MASLKLRNRDGETDVANDIGGRSTVCDQVQDGIENYDGRVKGQHSHQLRSASVATCKPNTHFGSCSTVTDT